MRISHVIRVHLNICAVISGVVVPYFDKRAERYVFQYAVRLFGNAPVIIFITIGEITDAFHHRTINVVFRLNVIPDNDGKGAARLVVMLCSRLVIYGIFARFGKLRQIAFVIAVFVQTELIRYGYVVRDRLGLGQSDGLRFSRIGVFAALRHGDVQLRISDDHVNWYRAVVFIVGGIGVVDHFGSGVGIKRRIEIGPGSPTPAGRQSGLSHRFSVPDGLCAQYVIGIGIRLGDGHFHYPRGIGPVTVVGIAYYLIIDGIRPGVAFLRTFVRPGVAVQAVH